ncbi:MAG: NAD-dependent epimerase/dehydratase family protein [Bacteroidales bacterium]|nr:NAD-dependent epimerase/dehydratase family protein [Bacteroidales bacterium]
MLNKNSKIYVAGHTGLVGSAITAALKRKGYSNIVGRTFGELDLRRQEDTESFFAAEKPEAVILCAAKVGGIMANNTLRAEFIYENLMIQSNVVHAAYLNGVKKLVFLGSSCIYPRDCPQPMREDHLLTSPLEYTNEPYAIAKIAGLKMCEAYNMRYGTDFIAVMPTNLYGANDNFNLTGGHVLPSLIRRIHLGKLLENGDMDGIRADLRRRPSEGFNGSETEEKIMELLSQQGIHGEKPQIANRKSQIAVSVWGTGKPLREFMYSGDMADATIYIMEEISFKDVVPAGTDEIRNTHINIGTGEEISIRDLARMVKETTGFRGELVFDHSKPDGTPRKFLDSSKLRSLGFRHATSLREGMARVYDWYLEN